MLFNVNINNDHEFWVLFFVGNIFGDEADVCNSDGEDDHDYGTCDDMVVIVMTMIILMVMMAVVIIIIMIIIIIIIIIIVVFVIIIIIIITTITIINIIILNAYRTHRAHCMKIRLSTKMYFSCSFIQLPLF